MSTEQLIIELDAKTSKLDAKLKKVERQLDGVEGSTKKADSSLSKFGKVAGMAGATILKTAAAATVLAGAITAMALSSASSRRELEQFARQAKTTEEGFQSLSFAANQYGITAEQTADISKDLSDKLGEFATAGTGAFQDYADVMGLTKKQAVEVAQEFQHLSSEEVIGRMVSGMENVGATSAQTTFVLESMGNDLSKLTPLFADNAKELEILKKRYDDVNKSLQITDNQAEELRKMATSFDLMKTSGVNAASSISATIAPVLDDFFNGIIEVVPGATQAIIDFINSFLSAENITTIAGVEQQIEDSISKISELRGQSSSYVSMMSGATSISLVAEQKRLEELQAQLEVLKEQAQVVADANQGEGGTISGNATGGGFGAGDTPDDVSSQLEAIQDRFKSEIELLREKYEEEKEILDQAVLDEEERLLLRADLFNEYVNNKAEAEKKAEKSTAKTKKSEANWAKKTEKEKLNAAQDGVRQGIALNQILFDDNKAIGAGLIVADTAIAISKANSLGYPVSIPAMVLAAATGVAQLSALQSSTKGGGSISTGGGALGAPPPLESFTPEQSEVGLDFQTDEGSSSNAIIFDEDSVQSFLDSLSGAIDNNVRNGRA